jgi:hypothetical protein
VLATIGRRTPLPAAAVLVVGVLAFVIALQAGNAPTQRQSVKHTTPPLDPTVITVKHAQHFGKRHLSCSRGLEELPEAGYKCLGRQPPLGWSRPSWALSLWVWVERGVKRCIRGCRRRPDTGRDERLSPWIAPYENSPVIESVRICCAIGNEVPHPVLIWRSRDMVYYLVGDSFSGVKAAARRMQR